jgi:hypothetical protein
MLCGLTQFARAMKGLDIHLIYAHSPQAKGGIERSNSTLQDPLVKELRLNKISTIEEANTFRPQFIEDYNRRFAVIPKDSCNVHRALLNERNLELIFTSQDFRQLSKTLTFQHNRTIYQIWIGMYALRKAQVKIYEPEDGAIEVLYKGKPLAFRAYNF